MICHDAKSRGLARCTWWPAPSLATLRAAARRSKPASSDLRQHAAHGRPAAPPASNPLKEAYFGEQHLHTAYSLDAYIGGARLTPSDAYRFAKGDEVEVGGVKVRLHAPLDWAAVTDHAEYLGEMYSTMNESAPGYEQRTAQGAAEPHEHRGAREVVPRVRASRTTAAHASASAILRRPGDQPSAAGRRILAAAASTTSRERSRPSRPSSGAPRPRAATSTATCSSATRTCRTGR